MRKRTGFLALVMAAAMTLGTSVTAFAEDFTVKDGEQFEFDSTGFDMARPRAGAVSGHAVRSMYSISLEETAGNGVVTPQQILAGVPAGYELKPVVVRSKMAGADFDPSDGTSQVRISGSDVSDFRTTDPSEWNQYRGQLADYSYRFTLTKDGVPYTECGLHSQFSLTCMTEDGNFYHDSIWYVSIPQGYTGDLFFTVNPNKYVENYTLGNAVTGSILVQANRANNVRDDSKNFNFQITGAGVSPRSMAVYTGWEDCTRYEYYDLERRFGTEALMQQIPEGTVQVDMSSSQYAEFIESQVYKDYIASGNEIQTNDLGTAVYVPNDLYDSFVMEN